MKKRAFSQKIFFRFFTTVIRASREMSWGKMICLSKKFYFSVIKLEFDWFSCLCCKILWSGVSNHRSACGENKIGEINLEKLFSYNNLGLWAENTLTFSKTVRLDTQNRSLHVQMNILKKNSGSKNNCMKVFGHRTETSVFRRKCFLRVVKGAFQVSSSTL